MSEGYLCVGGPADGQWFAISGRELHIPQSRATLYRDYIGNSTEPMHQRTTYTYRLHRIYGMPVLLGDEWLNTPEFPENVWNHILNNYRIIKSA